MAKLPKVSKKEQKMQQTWADKQSVKKSTTKQYGEWHSMYGDIPAAELYEMYMQMNKGGGLSSSASTTVKTASEIQMERLQRQYNEAISAQHDTIQTLRMAQDTIRQMKANEDRVALQHQKEIQAIVTGKPSAVLPSHSPSHS